MMRESPIVVSGPAAPETLRVLRSVAAGVAAGLDASFDRVDELRMAVDEAATMLLGSGIADLLILELRRDDAGIDVAIRSDGPAVAGWPGPSAGSWAGKVLEALADDVRYDTSDGCPEVGFVWRLRRGDRVP